MNTRLRHSHFAPSQTHIQILCMAVCIAFFTGSSVWASPPLTPKATHLLNKTKPGLTQELRNKGFSLGQPLFVRILKMEGTLEVWLQKHHTYQLFKQYPICSYSGYPGPKLKEGDWQSPEGFYSVSARQMNPNSNYHLSFNIGYPNTFDREKKRTGSSIMVHGECSSRGCFAMGNPQMEEIYLLAHSALANGQERFDVHIFPFALTSRNLFKFRSSPWIGFWKELQPGFDAFEQNHLVPEIVVKEGSYLVNDKTMRVAMANANQKGKNNE